MADVNITFSNTTPAEARAAAWALAEANKARAAQNPPLPPFATVKLFLEASLQDRVLSWIKAEAEANVTTANIKKRWDLATDAQRTAALAQLPPAP